MGDVKLSTDKTVSIDLSKVEWGEWREFWKSNLSEDEEALFIEKITGISPDEQFHMLRDDFRRMIQAVHKEGQEPLADPN